MKTYSTYLFDVGGTLLKFDTHKLALAYAERAASSGVAVTPIHAQATLEALELEIPARQKTRKLSLQEPAQARAFWVELWADGFRRLGVDEAHSRVFADDLLDSYNGAAFQSVFDDVVPTLDALRARGAQLGIVSNFSRNCEDLLRECGLHGYFIFFIVSGIIGIEKPDPRIFEAAVEKAGKPKAEIVYVGDSLFHDVEGAHGAGLEAILVDRSDRYRDFAGVRVTRLSDIAN